MSKGFFSDTQQSHIGFAVPRCQSCGLSRGCDSPKMPFTGEGKRGVLIVAEAPGATEDERGTQLIGKAGQLLRNILEDIGWDLDEDCWKTNAIICRPPDNRTPVKKEIESCRPCLMKTIKKLHPKVVVLMGSVAVNSLLEPIWRKGIGAIGRWVGCRIPLRELNLWACPIWHPSYLLRRNNEELELWFRRYLEEALKIQKEPWKKIPLDYDKHIIVKKDHRDAAKSIRSFTLNEVAVAFDYETDRLKPDANDAKIVSCAISNGTYTVAYPWVGDAITATSELLKSPTPKIAANIKFEERWTRKILGHGVRNWKWDTMQAAHVLNNEPGITSVKFQAFIRFGIGDYDSHISSYLKGLDSNTSNRIKELRLADLLLYNGMDALLEFKIAEQQMEEMGVNYEE